MRKVNITVNKLLSFQFLQLLTALYSINILYTITNPNRFLCKTKAQYPHETHEAYLLCFVDWGRVRLRKDS
jgi:hypothetical protein